MERAIYRIIDANFNRAREAARVMEEYCRFALASTALSSRAKELRHRLSRAVDRLDARMLAAARDCDSDVGRGMRVGDQMVRRSLADCSTAAAKRLTEALRALAETVGVFDPELAALFEALRFDAYTLEKDIALTAIAAERFKAVRLYVLITMGPDDPPGRILDLAVQCADGGADCLQLRAKGIADDRLFALAQDFVKVCTERNVISIINDRTDIAVVAAADGVHLGQNDLGIAQARKLQKKPMIFGISTHSIDQLDGAIEQTPAYVAVGPVFPTATKPNEPCVGLEYVAAATKKLKPAGIAHVAIGGITLDNVDTVLHAGARAIAVCAAVTAQGDPAGHCQRFKDKITAEYA
ncbi:MAG: thiamine phosphate synthase [Planctomycetes bacterium]|nr:thiamine phosphate synthase [Planctomycetota bacterium]